MPPRSWEWSKRISFGPAPLDWGVELWKWDVARFESTGGIIAAYRRTGRSFDDDTLLFEATRSLLADVVDSAGGVEGAVVRLHNAIELAQERYVHYSAQLRPLTDGGGFIDPSVEDAWYALEETLVWARTLDDRLKRPAVMKNRGYPDQGLIPALAEGPRREAVTDARARLLNGPLGEARYLSGLGLHMQSIQAGSKGGTIRSGQVVLAFPDCVAGPVAHRWQLTFEDGRDGVWFADALLVSVERFMDEMLTAFETHLPERLRVGGVLALSEDD